MCKPRDEKLEQEEKRRCAEFMLEMIEKYGAEVAAENSVPSKNA